MVRAGLRLLALVVALTGCAQTGGQSSAPNFDLIRRQDEQLAGQVAPSPQRLGGSALVVLENTAALRRNVPLTNLSPTVIDNLIASNEIHLLVNGTAIEKGRIFDRVTIVRADAGAQVPLDSADYKIWVEGYGSLNSRWMLAKRDGGTQPLVLPKNVGRLNWLNGLNIAVINAAAEMGAPVARLPLPQPLAATRPGIPSGPSSGTGFFIDSRGHALTNAHVVEGCKSVKMVLPEGRKAEAAVAARDVHNDLALLTVTPPQAAYAQFEGRTPRQGEDVVVYGFPLVGALSTQGNLTTGIVSALVGLQDDTRLLQISAPVQPGNSGGPLFDNTGAVIGIVSSKMNALRVANVTGDVPQNVNFAIKSNIVLNFLETNNVSVEKAQAHKPLAVADIGDRARSFTYMVACER